MVAQVFTDQELEALRRFPEIGREELFRFFTLTPADIAFVAPGRGRGPTDRLGLSVALCTLPWLGFVPDDVAAAPPAAGPDQQQSARLRLVTASSPSPPFGWVGDRFQVDVIATAACRDNFKAFRCRMIQKGVMVQCGCHVVSD
ncbi:DUF4158 domain-containing protein [Saccharopolyspora shandongensis]|uniref:DUF4158 domain-containing protein n=1 Tax=Saccharopolyspora shandongensis TaxID=418495 RepID=UPI0033D6BA6A